MWKALKMVVKLILFLMLVWSLCFSRYDRVNSRPIYSDQSVETEPYYGWVKARQRDSHNNNPGFLHVPTDDDSNPSFSPNTIRHQLHLRRPVRPSLRFDYGRNTSPSTTLIPPTPFIPEDIKRRFFADSAELPFSSAAGMRSKNQDNARTTISSDEEIHRHHPPQDEGSEGKYQFHFGVLDVTPAHVTRVRNFARDLSGDTIIRIKRVMRNVKRLSCKQYVNMRRAEILSQRAQDLCKKEESNLLKNCLAMYRI